MASSEKADMPPYLSFVVAEPLVRRFCLFLQGGFMVRARVGCSVDAFLREQMELGADVIERIQSIFLDGSPVDDLGSAMIRDGSTLALSAAMPGLVGATLRRGGTYSSFRSSITYKDAGDRCIQGEGLVRVKLFNLLMDELGPGLLRKGVLVDCAELRDFLKGQSRDFWQGCKNILLNGKPAEPGLLEDSASLSRHDQVFLSVNAGVRL